jgi:hypothetical protein
MTHVAPELGAARYEPSSTIKAYAAKRGLPLTDGWDYRDRLRTMTTEDPDVLLGPILDSPARIICVASLRRLSDVRRLESHHGIPVCTLSLQTSVYEDYQRVIHDPTRAARWGSTPPTEKKFVLHSDMENFSADPLMPAVSLVTNPTRYTETIIVDPYPDGPSLTQEQVAELGLAACRRLIAQVRIDSMQQR